MLVHCKLTQGPYATWFWDTAFGVICQLPFIWEEFRLSKLILHSELRRRAASRRALPCPSSCFFMPVFCQSHIFTLFASLSPLNHHPSLRHSFIPHSRHSSFTNPSLLRSPPYQTDLTDTGLFYGFSYSSVYFFSFFPFQLKIVFYSFLKVLPVYLSRYWILVCLLLFKILFICISFSYFSYYVHRVSINCANVFFVRTLPNFDRL